MLHIAARDGIIVDLDLDGDGEWDALEWDDRRIGKTVYRYLSANLDAGNYRIRTYYWQYGDQNSKVELAWRTPGSTDTVTIPAGAFGEPKGAGIPYALVESISLDGTVLESEDGESFVCYQEEVLVVGALINAPADIGSAVFTWDMGDSIVEHTVETARDTVTYVYSSPGNYQPILTGIEYGGEFPAREWQSFRKVQLAGCAPAASFTTVLVDDDELTSGQAVDICDKSRTLKFVGQADGARKEGDLYTFQWTVRPDSMIESTTTGMADTVEMSYMVPGTYTPIVKVLYGAWGESEPASAPSAIQIKDCAPVAAITEIRIGDKTLGEGDSIDVCPDRVAALPAVLFSGAATVKSPGDSITWTWNLGDTTRVVKTVEQTVTINHVYDHGLGDVRPTLTVSYGPWGESAPAQAPFAFDVTDCPVSLQQYLAGLKPVYKLVGNQLKIRTRDAAPVTVRLFSASGREVLSRKLVSNLKLLTIDFDQEKVANGAYALRLYRNDSMFKSWKMVIR